MPEREQSHQLWCGWADWLYCIVPGGLCAQLSWGLLWNLTPATISLVDLVLLAVFLAGALAGEGGDAIDRGWQHLQSVH